LLQLILLAGFGAIAAGNAGHPHEDGTGAVWVAPELLGALEMGGLSSCMHDVVIEPARMQYDGRVSFEWHAATGELSFAGESTHAVTRPAISSPSPEPLPLAMQSCESR
jgi:hypothetical protein